MQYKFGVSFSQMRSLGVLRLMLSFLVLLKLNLYHDAKKICRKWYKICSVSANMPCTIEAIEYFLQIGIYFGLGKLLMRWSSRFWLRTSSRSMRLAWPFRSGYNTLKLLWLISTKMQLKLPMSMGVQAT